MTFAITRPISLADLIRDIMTAEPAAPCFRAEMEQRFMAMVERHNALITKICFYFASGSAEFDDLRQDSLLNLWRGLSSYRGESAESTWIYRICLNTCVSTARRSSRHSMPSLDAIGCDMTDNDETESINERIALLHKCISRLGPLDKSLVMMQLDGQSYEEIAAVAGMKRNTVATRLARARQKLGQMINEDL